MTFRLEFENYGNSKEYEFEIIWDSMVYANTNKSESDVSGLYYLVLWKSYPDKDNI